MGRIQPDSPELLGRQHLHPGDHTRVERTKRFDRTRIDTLRRSGIHHEHVWNRQARRKNAMEQLLLRDLNKMPETDRLNLLATALGKRDSSPSSLHCRKLSVA